MLARILLLVLFVQGIHLHSQTDGENSVIDSLNSVLRQNMPDSSRINTLLNLASDYYRIDIEQARKIATEARDLALKSDYKSGLALSHKALGMTYYYENDWVNALVEWKLALDLFKSINDLNGESNMLNNLGVVHYQGGDVEAATKFYLQSLKVAEITGDTLRTVTALINIGNIYLQKPNTHDLALNYFKRALPICEDLQDFDAIGICAGNIGEIYLADSLLQDSSHYALQLDSALYYFERSLDASQKSNAGNVARAMYSIGKVYGQRGDTDKAIEFQKEAYALAKALEDRVEMSQALLSLAASYEDQRNYGSAVESYGLAAKIAEEIDASVLVLNAYQGLANSYSEINRSDSAFKYLDLYSELRDTLYNAEMDKKLQAQTLSYEIEQKQDQISLLEKDQMLKEVELERQKAIRNGTAIAGILLLILIAGLYNRYKFTKKTNNIIAIEKKRSDDLLLNILPVETAEELKEKGSATPRFYPKVSVLFTDFKGFTKIAEKLSPEELVEELNECFIAFDKIIDKHNLEKIKTIGDAYMCAGGIPIANDQNPFDVVKAALEIKEFMEKLRKERETMGLDYWELRIGIHTGPVIAGVVGKNKFAYDIWGDAVNTASRMESSGIPGEVNISGATYELIKDQFTCKYRGKIEAKNKGEIDMYLVDRVKSDAILANDNGSEEKSIPA